MRSRQLRAVALGSTTVVVAALAVAQVATAGNANAAAQRPNFHRVASQKVTGKNIQALSNKAVQVMVQVQGDPIMVADAKAGRDLTRGAKADIRQSLKARQSGIASQVRALGGEVGASYQAAYNGMKVTVASRQVNSLRSIPGVVAVHPLTPKSFSNIHGVPLIGAPKVWAGAGAVPGIAGEGIKFADIDTGIDYTHADFGGPGTAAAYQQALATDTAAPDPSLVGPDAPRVKGGYDFVGDDYNADPNDAHYQPVAHPDPNPLDCNGHGTHTAGTAAGSGVLADGSTYTGPYNTNTVPSHDWNVGPGAAPRVDIYSLRVFGCAGSTDVVVDAIEWAADHGMDVINMSLGAPFGGPDDPDSVASNNAAQDGVIVVTSSGNEGPNPYMTGDPGTADAAISTAAIDPTSSFPAANIALPGGVNVQAIDANGVAVNGLTAPIKVLYTGTPHDAAHISLGCDPAEYTAAGVEGDIVVVQRGNCARVARAIFGQEAGAAAVIMVNSTDDFPPFEGKITENPDDGQQFTVTIPFLGVKSSSGPALVAADGQTATLTDTTLANPSFLATASFSSAGPRSGDSALKPDVSAPGVSIASAGMGTGDQAAVMSGTSMASPHNAGTAALVREAHPTWGQVRYWKAAIVNTADPSQVNGYAVRSNGTGLIQALPATQTQAVALGTNSTATLNFGYNELGSYSGYSQNRTITLHNFSAAPITFKATHNHDGGSPHNLGITAGNIIVAAHGTKSVTVNLTVPAKTAGDSSAFHDVSGLISFAPQNGANNDVTLRMAYYMVPHALSKVTTSLNTATLKSKHTATATLHNAGGIIPGGAHWYAWGISDPNEADLTGSDDIKAVGAQTFPGDGVLAFGLSTWHRWSNAAANEYDIYVDVNRDGVDDYVVSAADYGLVTAGDNNGEVGDFVFDLRTGDGSVDFLADAPTDSTTMAIPVAFDQFCNPDHPASPCLSGANARISYHVEAFGRDGTTDTAAVPATFNVMSPAVSTGMFDVVAPNKTVTRTVTLDPAEYAVTPPKGFLILSHDNAAATEAQTIAI
jgi:subtilisin family serine protease